jgi:ribose transport system substrate-binding protein
MEVLMSRRSIFLGPLCLSALALTLAGCSKPASSPGPGAAPTGSTSPAASALQIAVIPKGSTHEYWSSVEAGADQAGKELGVSIIWKAPVLENDRAGQISIVQQFVSEGVSGIVLAPLDNKALVPVVAQAKAANIPVVIIDSSLDGKPGIDFASFVATDNYHGGVLAGQQMIKVLNGKGKVVLLRYAVGSASTEAREKGFLDTVAKAPGITIIDKDHYAGATEDTAQTESMQLIDELKTADGIFTPNESSTLGMLKALQASGLAGKVKFVGFDATPPIIDAVKAGYINAVIAQNPVHMGYVGVETVVAKIKGQPVPTTVDTGACEIDKSNLNSAPVQKILSGN